MQKSTMMHYSQLLYNRVVKFADKRIVHFILFVLFFLFLEFEYFNFINIPLFRERMGFDFAFCWQKFLIGKLLFGSVLFLNFKLKQFDYFINSLFLLFLTIPSIILYEFMPNTPIGISLSVVLFHLVFYLSSFISVTLPKKEWVFNKNYVLYFLLALLSVMLIPFIIDYGFSINMDAFNYKKVYEIRAIGVAKLTTLTAYTYGWIVKIIIPIAMVFALRNRKWLWVGLLLILLLYLYSIMAHRSVFVSIFILFIMYVKSYSRQVNRILLVFISLFIVSKLVSIYTGEIIFESLVVRRTFFIPAIITKNYVDFFSDINMYWSNSILKYFTEYPYDLQPNLLIGKEYFNGSIKSANSGFISEGYMNFGYLGIFINSIIVAGIFRLFSYLKISSDYSGLFIIIIYTLVNSFLFTSLLTHGIFIFLLLSFFTIRNSLHTTH